MPKTIATILTLAALALPSAAAAKPRLSMHRAKAALTANAHLDRPTAISITGCKRLSRIRISCTVSETAAHTLIFDDGQPMTGQASWPMDAVLAHGRVIVD